MHEADLVANTVDTASQPHIEKLVKVDFKKNGER